jgi:hypothetical protein
MIEGCRGCVYIFPGRVIHWLHNCALFCDNVDFECGWMFRWFNVDCRVGGKILIEHDYMYQLPVRYPSLFNSEGSQKTRQFFDIWIIIQHFYSKSGKSKICVDRKIRFFLRVKFPEKFLKIKLYFLLIHFRVVRFLEKSFLEIINKQPHFFDFFLRIFLTFRVTNNWNSLNVAFWVLGKRKSFGIFQKITFYEVRYVFRSVWILKSFVESHKFFDQFEFYSSNLKNLRQKIRSQIFSLKKFPKNNFNETRLSSGFSYKN